jgi:hypothetical protein
MWGIIMKALLLVFAAVIVSGCVTRSVWNEHDPNGYIIVPKEIFDKDMAGRIDVPYLRLDGDDRVYVKRSGLTKFKAYAVRAITTPFTITVDVCSFAIVGSLGLASIPAASPGAVVEIGNAVLHGHR